jgi:sulfur-oxidizing protein SoxZ
MATIRARVPAQARQGEIVQVRALIQHPMETGFRRDEAGRHIPRRIIHEFVCEYGGETVFRAEFFPAVSADPFLAFSFRASKSGDVKLIWRDDSGETYGSTHRIEVT